MNDDTTSEWIEYVSNVSAIPDTSSTLFSDFLRDKERLFAKESIKTLLETWIRNKKAAALEKSYIITDQDLNIYLDRSRTGDNTVALNIPQATSWSRLKIPFSMFARLCHSLQLTPTFLELVSTFGYRREDSDNHFSASFWRAVPIKDSPDQTFTYDVCYNVRYVDLHGRSRPDPWSFRNFAVYHRYHTSGHSNWIFINFPNTLKGHLTTITEDAGHPDLNRILWHLSFFKFCLTNWRNYINFMDANIQQISKAVSFTRLNKGGRSDYHLDFSSCQRLGNLRQKLERSVDILRSYEGIACTLRNISGHLYGKKLITEESSGYLENALQEQLFIAQGHERKLQMLIRSCDFVIQMLFQLLNLRNDAVTHENGNLLREISGHTILETKNIAWLSRQTCADARGTKITTLISMAYAPAAVIAGIFSSNLIEIYSENHRNSFHVRKEMWIFTIAVAALTFATVGVSWYLERRQNQLLHPKKFDGAAGGKSYLGD